MEEGGGGIDHACERSALLHIARNGVSASIGAAGGYSCWHCCVCGAGDRFVWAFQHVHVLRISVALSASSPGFACFTSFFSTQKRILEEQW